MREVARSTSAAPTYFAAERLSVKPPTAMVDGGVFANNPAMCAYVEAIKLHPDADPRDVLVVSLGMGQVTTPIHYARARVWGLIGWVRPGVGPYTAAPFKVAAAVEARNFQGRRGQLRSSRVRTTTVA